MRVPAEFFRMRFFALITLLAGSLFGQQDWRFAHPDATLVGGLHPAALLESPMLANAMTQAGQKDPSAVMMLGMVRGLLGGVTDVRFSVLDNGTKEPDVLALISGRLDEAMLGLMAQGQGQTQAKWKRLDANTILMGNGASLEKAFARMQPGAVSLQSRALEGTELLAGHDFWLAGKVPPSMSSSLKVAGAGDANFKSLAFGMSLHDDIQMELTAQMGTAAQAEALVKSAHAAETSQAPQLRGQLKSFVEGTTAHFRVSVPKDVAMSAMQSGVATGALPGLSTAAPIPQAPAAPKRQTIVIEGLDDGPKEIPLKK